MNRTVYTRRAIEETTQLIRTDQSAALDFQLQRTHKMPSPKMLLVPIFCTELMWSFLMKEIGRQSMLRSSTMSVTLEQTYMTG